MMVQGVLVAAAVLLALVYTLWVFMPAAWRQRVQARLGLRARWARVGACSDCNSCGACAKAPAAPKRMG